MENNLITKINVDSISNLDIFPRENAIFVVRYKRGSDLNYIQFVCKRNNKNDLVIKYHDEWVLIDSLFKKNEFKDKIRLLEKIKYSVNVYWNLDIMEIVYDSELNGIRVTLRNGKVYYHIDDMRKTSDFEEDSLLIKLENNWWIEK